jgi:hypothetical protein
MFARLCAMLLVTALAVGCGGESAEVPKNPAPKPSAAPGSSLPEGQGQAGKTSAPGAGAKKL